MATSEPTPPALPETNAGCETEHGIEMRREVIDPRKYVVTEQQLSNISDDVGTCWRELGPKLNIASSKLQNLDDEYRCNRDKANALLLLWKQKEGSGAVAGRLADALESIERKSIAEKLLGVSDVNMPKCAENVFEGHAISLTVIHVLGAELDKLMLCEDARGNKYMVKALDNNDKFLNLDEVLISKRFLETVAVARQESLKRYISSELQELRLQMKEVKLDCGDVDSNDGVQNNSRDTTQPIATHSLFDDKVDLQQGESIEQLLHSCEEHRSFCQMIFGALIKLTGEVGQLSEDNAKCIKQLTDFTMELREQERAHFSKIEFVRSQSQHLDEQHVVRAEELVKWKTQQEVQFMEVEKLLSELRRQGSMERAQSQRSQKLPQRKSEPDLSTKSPPGYGRKSPRHHSEGELPQEIKIKNPFMKRKSEDKESCVLLSYSKAPSEEGNYTKES